MKINLLLKKSLVALALLCTPLTVNITYATQTPSAIISNFSEFEVAVIKAINNLSPSIVLQVPSKDLNAYASKLDSIYGVDYCELKLIAMNGKYFLTLDFTYHQAFRIVKYLDNPSLEKYLTSQDKSLLALAKNIVSEITTPDMSDYEKELAIHDYIVNTASYDYKNLATDTLPDSAYTAYGILVNKSGVCQGYSEATQLLCKLAGIQCDIVIGYGTSQTSSTPVNHAWNVVKIGNSWYMLDTTYDDLVCTYNNQTSEILSHDYFNVTNAMLSKDHEWDQSAYPRASNLLSNYYYMSNSMFDTPEEFQAYVISQIEAGETNIVCYIYGYNSKDYDLNFIYNHYSGKVLYLEPSSTDGSLRIFLY